jgi:hypothetical protein
MKKKLEKEQSHFIGNYRIYLDVDGNLTIIVIDGKRGTIRIEPISSNSIKVQSD